MLTYLLIFGIAYGIAYGITSTGLHLWRAIVGFALAFLVAWFGGSLLGTILITWMKWGDENSLLPIIGKGFWWALFGAGVGVSRAKHKLRKDENASPLSIPKWVGKATLVIFLIGIIAAVALPQYQDYKKRASQQSFNDYPNFENGVITQPQSDTNPWERKYEISKDPAPKPSVEGGGVVAQETKSSFEVRASGLMSRIKAGTLSRINASVAQSPRQNEYHIPKSDVAKIEDAQTWWKTADGLFIHIVNSSQFNVASIGIEHAPSRCEDALSLSPFVLQLEYFIEPGREAVVQFSSPTIGVTQGVECLNVVNGWSINRKK
ncbi:hypothetical protein [Acidovorax sp. RAC01]|uniref:hypothetical protein n=1 Tax=Acidovorax sp. RAC01 TaxID=1842533 RepID=UPI00085765FE|nr:hypothetical protein [Acidovorax sp. RAC01]AOG21737.1 hypothetical protein BSY15_980 [Acidovorax sp. RAC01]